MVNHEALGSTTKPPPPPRWTLCSLWSRYHVDGIWLVVYLLLNALVFWLRFRQYDVDACVAFAPAVAKGSAEVVMLNCVLTMLSVCHRVIDRLRYWVSAALPGGLLFAQRPLEMHRAFHVLTGTVVVAMALVHSLAWGFILHRSRTCDAAAWHASALATRTATARMRDEPSLGRLLVRLPMWTGLALLLGAVVLLPFSLGNVRRLYFNSFATVHRIVLPPFVILLLFHGAAQWTSHLQSPVWLVPTLTIYALERRHRLSQRTTSTILCVGVATSSSKPLAHTTLRLFLTKTERFQQCFEPGMFVYLQVPAISGLEWHPFSVCSSQHDALIELRVRVVGDWTRQLLSHLTSVVDTEPLGCLAPAAVPVRVDGPFGTPTRHYARYNDVLLVALGMGITPFLAVLRHQLHTWRRELRLVPATASHSPRLSLVWIVRDPAQLAWLIELLYEFDDVLCVADPTALAVRVFVTSGSAASVCRSVDVRHGRPHWPTVLAQWTCTIPDGRHAAVIVGGSHAAARAVKRAVASSTVRGIDVYTERFH